MCASVTHVCERKRESQSENEQDREKASQKRKADGNETSQIERDESDLAPTPPSYVGGVMVCMYGPRSHGRSHTEGKH